MTLYFIGHTYKHKVESLCKMFFPCTKILLKYEDLQFTDRQNIITRVRKGKYHTSLLCIYMECNKIYRFRYTLHNDCKNDQKLCERILCKAVYRVLEKATRHSLPWGILTGIRPIKMVNRLLAEGKTENEIRTYLQEEFLISKEKLDLCLSVASIQKPILKKMKSRTFSLYVSVPFCPTRCGYCSFVSQSIAMKNAQNLMEPYVEKLCEELVKTAEIANARGLKLETIYYGGGTPTSLTERQLKKVTDCIASHYDLSALKEYTVEAGRPDTITKGKLEILKSAGVTRISINPQSFQDTVLLASKRNHTAADTLEKYAMAREAGFKNINMDFIAGLPSDHFEQFKDSLETGIRLQPENITIHTLSFKRASDFYTLAGVPDSIDQDTEKSVAYARKRLQHFAYQPYYMYRQKNTVGNLENTGYAKAGTESLYNIYIMEENHSILAVGANGVTKLVSFDGMRIQRIFNYKFPNEYIRNFSEILKRKEQVKNFYDNEKASEKKGVGSLRE